MPDTDARPMTDADTEIPPADTAFEPAAPLKDTGVEFEADANGTAAPADGTMGTTKATQALKNGAAKLGGEASDRLRAYALDGQARAGTALDQLVQLLHDAADQVDGKLGAQYGDYARQAAGSVSGFSETIRNKDVDELFDDARSFVRKSPAVAVGGAAAVGFVLARLFQSGLEATRAADSNRA